ncbi:MAG: restriction endonuclease [Thermoprotei archaeon]
MVTARERFIVNRLLEKGGVVNKVATRYVAAGFNVRVKPNINDIDIIAIRNTKMGERYGIKVLHEKREYGVEVVNRVLETCKQHSLKPVLILYGSGPRLSEEALNRAREEGVIVKRIR